MKPDDFTMPAMSLTTTPPPGGADATRAALAWTHTARFLTTASRLDQLPGP